MAILNTVLEPVLSNVLKSVLGDGGAAGPPVTVSFEASPVSGVNASSYTFNSVAFGSASSDVYNKFF